MTRSVDSFDREPGVLVTDKFPRFWLTSSPRPIGPPTCKAPSDGPAVAKELSNAKDRLQKQGYLNPDMRFPAALLERFG